jgi:hypothetical protein
MGHPRLEDDMLQAVAVLREKSKVVYLSPQDTAVSGPVGSRVVQSMEEGEGRMQAPIDSDNHLAVCCLVRLEVADSRKQQVTERQVTGMYGRMVRWFLGD